MTVCDTYKLQYLILTERYDVNYFAILSIKYKLIVILFSSHFFFFVSMKLFISIITWFVPICICIVSNFNSNNMTTK